MANWRLAESLKKLREQLNAAYPNRSKVSDGSIGDQSHSSRTSDHNPNSTGVVCAIDVTNDKKTLDGQWLADALVESRDPRIKYIIFNHEMCRSYPANGKAAWVWQPYTGVNAHEKHVHISVSSDKALYDSTREWALPLERAAGDDIEEDRPEPSPSPLPVLPPAEDPPQQTASVTIKDGGIEMKTSEAPTAPERIAVEKPAPLGFAASMKKKVSGVLGGNVGLQFVREQAEGAKALGLSSRFWVWISIFAVVAGLVWLAVEIYRHWSTNKREMEITNQLIAANTNDVNKVVLVDKDKIEEFKERGYRIVYR